MNFGTFKIKDIFLQLQIGFRFFSNLISRYSAAEMFADKIKDVHDRKK